MLSMVLLRFLQNVSFRAFYCRYVAGIVLGVQEIVFLFSYYILHPYDDAESILVSLVGSSGCRQLTEVLLLVA